MTQPNSGPIFPLSTKERLRLLIDLKVIAPLNTQAKKNLTENARDLWVTGIRGIENQSIVLNDLKKQASFKDDVELVSVIDEAIASNNDLVSWLPLNPNQKLVPQELARMDNELLIFEQHLYLRQPGYGTSYITGKYLLENTLSNYA